MKKRTPKPLLLGALLTIVLAAPAHAWFPGTFNPFGSDGWINKAYKEGKRAEVRSRQEARRLDKNMRKAGRQFDREMRHLGGDIHDEIARIDD
jgi:hypothetical protein